MTMVGLQYFTGTQKKIMKKIAGEVEYIEDFAEKTGERGTVCDAGAGIWSRSWCALFYQG